METSRVVESVQVPADLVGGRLDYPKRVSKVKSFRFLRTGMWHAVTGLVRVHFLCQRFNKSMHNEPSLTGSQRRDQRTRISVAIGAGWI